jgi:secondary thiamine-phosphate synthase enzyme
MQYPLWFSTPHRECLVDITDRIRTVVQQFGQDKKLCALYAQGATAAVMIQENWDPNIGLDVIACLQRLVPRGVWLHDREDGNGDAHIKAGIVGPSETIPVANGELLMSTWQNIFFCEFDGPREERTVIVTLL